MVRFREGVLEPLFNCHAKGQYAYSPEGSMQVRDDIIENSDELQAKLPGLRCPFAPRDDRSQRSAHEVGEDQRAVREGRGSLGPSESAALSRRHS